MLSVHVFVISYLDSKQVSVIKCNSHKYGYKNSENGPLGIVIIFLSISLNIHIGCSKDPSLLSTHNIRSG